MQMRNFQYLNKLNTLKEKKKKKAKKTAKKIINKINPLNLSSQPNFFFDNFNLFLFPWENSNINDKIF